MGGRNGKSTTFGYQLYDNLAHCNFIREKSQVWREWRPTVLNFTILYSCYLKKTINFILTTLRQIVSPNALLCLFQCKE